MKLGIIEISFVISLLLLLFSCSDKNIETVPTILFLGDSHIKRWDLNYQFPQINAINSGKGGARINDLFSKISNQNVAKCCLEIGTNDCRVSLRNGITESLIIEQVKLDYQLLIDSLANTFTKTYVLSLLPPGRDELKDELKIIYPQLNIVLEEICALYSQVQFIPIYNHLKDEEGFLSGQFTQDQLHLNNNGYEVLKPILVPFLYD